MVLACNVLAAKHICVRRAAVHMLSHEYGCIKIKGILLSPADHMAPSGPVVAFI